MYEHLFLIPSDTTIAGLDYLFPENASVFFPTGAVIDQKECTNFSTIDDDLFEQLHETFIVNYDNYGRNEGFRLTLDQLQRTFTIRDDEGQLEVAIIIT